MKKKHISVLLALALLVSVFALTMLGASAEEGHSHCVCGGVGKLGDHECGEAVEWTAIGSADELTAMLVTSTGDEDGKGNSSFLRFADDYDTGYYYLTADISITKVIEIHQADDIHLCLNGHTLTHTSSTGNSPWRVWGKLSISDCSAGGTGKIISYKNAPMIYMMDNYASDSGIYVNIYGGTIEYAATKASSNVGVLRIGAGSGTVPCVVNLYNGTITGGKGASGGNVNLTSSGSVLNMYGGAITGGTASGSERNNNSGGNIFMTKGKFHMYGGAVSGGTCTKTDTASTTGYGNDIYMTDAVLEVLLDGSVGSMDIGVYGAPQLKLGENFACTGTITLDAYSENVTAVTSGVTHANAGCFAAADAENDQVVHFDGKILLCPAGSRFGCVCGGAMQGSEDHTCELLAWTPLTKDVFDTWTENTGDAGSRVSVEGNYYLTSDLEIDKGIRGTAAFNLDLNGYTLTRSDTADVTGEVTLRVASEINICDSSYDPAAEDYTGLFKGRIQSKGSSHIIAVGGNGTLSIYGGNVGDGNGKANTINLGSSTAKLYLYNGVVIGNTISSSNGANIGMTSGAVMNMYGGVVTGGSAYRGGNIAITNDSCSFTMNGGLITGGKATQNTAERGGGNIFSVGTVTITGGTISGGTAGSTTTNNGYGGSIHNCGGTLTITGGTFTNETATATAGYGGVIYSTGTMSISNVTITGGNASKSPSGGCVAVAGGTATITNSTLNAGWGSRGAIVNLSTAGSKLTITDSTLNGLTWENPYNDNGTDKVGNSVWVEGGTLKLVGDVKITGDACDLACGDVRFDPNIAIDISELETQEPISVRTQDRDPFENAMYAGDNDDVILTSDNVYLCAVYSDSYYHIRLAAIVGYDADGVMTVGCNSWADAMAADVTVYQMQTALDGGEITKAISLDLNGQTVTNVTIPADVTVQLYDTATDDFTGEYGCLSGTVEGTINTYTTANDAKYLVVCENGAYSAHCYDVVLTHVSLDPTNDALGYKAQLKGDEVVIAHVNSFGFNLWVDGGQVKTYAKEGTFVSDQVLTLRLKNIMKANGGEKNINANAFITFDVEDGIDKSDDHATSMKAAIEAVNAAVSADPSVYTEAQMLAVQEFVNTYAEAMASWQTEAIEEWS